MAPKIVPDSYAVEEKRRELERSLLEKYKEQLHGADPKQQKRNKKQIEKVVQKKLKNDIENFFHPKPWIRVLSITYLVALGLLVGWFVWLNVVATNVRFESSEGVWRDNENLFKGRDYAIVLGSFEDYKKRCGNRTAILYRTTTPNPFKVFEWWSYAHDPKWKVPYRPSQVSPDAFQSCPAQ
jgi:hypothetical protein